MDFIVVLWLSHNLYCVLHIFSLVKGPIVINTPVCIFYHSIYESCYFSLFILFTVILGIVPSPIINCQMKPTMTI